MIPPELSQLALEAFQKAMNGKWHADKSGNPWYYIPELQKATDAVSEAVLRWIQDEMNGKIISNHCDCSDGCGCCNDS